MKNILPKVSILVVFALAAGLARGDIHDPPGAAHGPTRKLGRGVSNLAFAPLEIPYQMDVVNGREGGAAALTYGVVKGVGSTFRRIGFGAYETVTFLFPIYKGSYRIPYRTEHRWPNGGLREFPPNLGGETHYPWVRIH
jgi:putative exosortase-associated protein (TIGR04073 family)